MTEVHNIVVALTVALLPNLVDTDPNLNQLYHNAPQSHKDVKVQAECRLQRLLSCWP